MKRLWRRAFAPLLLACLPVLAGCNTLKDPTIASETQAGPAIPVRQAQAGLAALNYRVGPVDGVLGPQTDAAVSRFRRREGLPEEGDPSQGPIDEAFADKLAERLAFAGLQRRQASRRTAAAKARATAPREAPTAEARADTPTAVAAPAATDGEDDALDALLQRWEDKAATPDAPEPAAEGLPAAAVPQDAPTAAKAADAATLAPADPAALPNAHRSTASQAPAAAAPAIVVPLPDAADPAAAPASADPAPVDPATADIAPATPAPVQ
ncbi:MAG: peptidoglycan-binding domain-containing protein [Pseudomonadota bacterium]